MKKVIACRRVDFEPDRHPRVFMFGRTVTFEYVRKEIRNGYFDMFIEPTSMRVLFTKHYLHFGIGEPKRMPFAVDGRKCEMTLAVARVKHDHLRLEIEITE